MYICPPTYLLRRFLAEHRRSCLPKRWVRRDHTWLDSKVDLGVYLAQADLVSSPKLL